MTMRPISFRRSFLVVLITALVVSCGHLGRAEAGFQAGNLGPNNAYSTQSGYNLTGPAFFTGQGYGIAVQFKIASPGAVSFDSAELGLTYRAGTAALDVSLMSDTGGRPSGMALETIHLTGIAAGPHLVTANSTAHSLLSAGINYWLVAIYGAPDTNIGWLANTVSQSGNSAYRPDTTRGIGSWLRDSSDSDPSYALFGTAANPNLVGAVDSPPSALLVGIGSLGMIGGHFYRRRRVANGPAR